MNENVSFNLIDEPWILVRGMEGEMREVSLMELFEQAPCIRRLANDLPTQDFAILRVSAGYFAEVDFTDLRRR